MEKLAVCAGLQFFTLLYDSSVLGQGSSLRCRVCVLNLYMQVPWGSGFWCKHIFYWGLGRMSCPALSSLVFCSASCSSMNSSAPEGWTCLWKYDLVRVGLTQCSSSVANSPPDLRFKAFCILSPPHIHSAVTATNHYCAHHAHVQLHTFVLGLY